MSKTKVRIIALSLSILIMTSGLVYAISVQGGIWEYGGIHNIGNWGAFSSYFHPSKHHWSSVTSTVRDNNSSTVSASAGSTSYAVISTYIGEHVNFDFGF